MIDKVMRDKIKVALLDKKNGGIQAIYARIRKYGTPFKNYDARYKYGKEPIIVGQKGLTRQAVLYRVRHGWDAKKAKTFVRNRDE